MSFGDPTEAYLEAPAPHSNNYIKRFLYEMKVNPSPVQYQSASRDIYKHFQSWEKVFPLLLPAETKVAGLLSPSEWGQMGPLKAVLSASWY